MPRPEFMCKALFVRSPRNGNSIEAHLGGKLDSQMAQASHAQDRNRVRRSCSAVPKRVECCDTGTQQRSRIDALQGIGNRRERFCGNHHIIGVAAIVRDSGDERILACDQIAPPAGLAPPTVPAIPANARTLPLLPLRHTHANRVYLAHYLMSRHPRVANKRKQSVYGGRIAVANTASLHAHPHLACPWFAYVASH